MTTSQGVNVQPKMDKVIPFIPEGDFYFTKGVEAFQKRKFDIAIKWLKKAVETSPDEALFKCQISIVYTEIGAYHLANQILTEVLADHGDDYIDCYYLIANNYAHLGLLQDAKKYTESYLEKAPDGDFHDEAIDLLGFIDIEDDDEDWTFEEEDELLILQETAFYHLEREEWEEALPILEELMSLFPEHMPAKHEYSMALFFSDSQTEAIRLEKQWLKKSPQSLYGHTNLAVFHHYLGNLEKSQKHLDALTNVYPIHEQQKLKIASTLAKTGRYEEAAARFAMLSKSQLKGHTTYFRWYSIAAYHTGNPDKALSLWEEGCKRHPHMSDFEGPWIHFGN
ncbi:tetratricopeptide repeat protein [Sediminibacillus massiliensis]|uniref:tetratricopeptide repeat protein n=1 Tax=Sediminibacillus massiliensis TaxID=1926277 RepID=UPI0009886092|nr:tetratricopeptide repeat protein [Sediminibacillus massiliensis]